MNEGNTGEVRVRFAPAPTGYLHVGSARSALFNWLYARHHGGTLVLRIEDTNAELASPEYYAAITDPLQWLGIDYDEGPYYQSERTEKYLAAIDALLASGAAYHCDCTREAIDQRNEVTGFKGGYDGHCRDHEAAQGQGTSVRFRTPDQGETVITDIVRGRVSFDNREFEDFVIRRGNGTPVFLVANAVDDADMGITHVVRGEDLLNTTPKVVLLWQALGYGELPVYAHLPLLVGENRKKLSKRKDSVALSEFEADGFLPEAMANYLALLGWGPPDDVEVRPLSEIVQLFDLADVNKAPAFFDIKKLEHINGEYIRQLSATELLNRLQPWLGESAPWPAEGFDPDVMAAVVPHIQERLKRLSDIGPLVDWLFVTDVPQETNEKEIRQIAKAMAREEVPAVLDAAVEALGSCEWDADSIGLAVREVGDNLGAKSQVPVRIAVTGRRVGPPLFEPMAMLSREVAVSRLRAARAAL